ncbi:diguanylate cyclase domain-containing protein [Trujillonella humicola]|uniref:diguanylate cyclase domain-containing protein n=1 Tax=Trujillonella humicola TaxID=3383699 RepID=UPI0039065283
MSTRPASPDGNGGMDDGLLRAVAESTEALLCVVDGEGRLLLVNPALQRFTGRPPAQLLGRRFTDVYVVPEHVELALDAVARAMDTGVAHPQEGDWLTGSGERRRVAMRNTVLTDAAGRPYAVACVGVDVTADRQREARLTRRADTDPLTGVANRGVLFDVLRARQAAGEPCGLLFCDLDGFKAVNDEHGHAVGDRVLTEAAGRLAGLVDVGQLVARFGGDEFVVVWPAATAADLAGLAQRVAARLALPFAGPDGTLHLGVSIGTAVGQPGESADELVARADRAMYGAKTHRRRRSARDEPPTPLR